MPASRPPPRVNVANPSDGGLFHWLFKLYGFAALVLGVVLWLIGVSVYGSIARSIPAVPDLEHYATEVAPGVTRILAQDGSLLGEFADERREVIPYDRFPKQLVNAFLDAEDHQFFAHEGIYFKGIVRAAWRNLTSGEFAQGGSTITQQLAKQFLTSEKTLDRKAKEAILARRIENRYSKEEILSVYMNHIFLGAGTYGVQAAAKRYFGRDVADLDVGEMALIAGLAQAPSRDSPLASIPNAMKRRAEVLDKMVRHGHLAAEDAEKWKAAPIVLATWHDVFLSTEPYFAEHVRRLVKEKYGQEKLMRGGLRVETSIAPAVDAVAYDTVVDSVRKQDKRQGWRGAEANLREGAPRKTFLERQAKTYGDGPLAEGRRYLALVESVTKGGAKVRVGATVYTLPLSRMSWAAKWSRVDAENDREIEDATEALKVGDVVWVAPVASKIAAFTDWTLDDHLNPHWKPEREGIGAPGEVQLEQTPHPQGAIYSMDHENGYVLAMVGGEDYARNEYNCATQALRQPGSTYKPIYYALALAEGYGFDTILNDVPHAEVDPVTGEVWVPMNLHGTVDYQVSLEYALVFSKNVPSVDIFGKLGGKNVEAWARRLGFTTKIIPDKALALGASSTYMDELTRAFAIFARDGKWIEPVAIRRVVDRDGHVIEDHTVPSDGALPPGDRLDRFAAVGGVQAKQAIPARAAYLVSKLLEEVVTSGYSGVIRDTKIPTAGKTGTSSATMDLWFVGFHDRWTTAAWLGDAARQRPLGKKDAAYMSALPMWARFSKQSSSGLELGPVPGKPPAGVKRDDRGDHSKGERMEQAMALVPPKKQKADVVPEGVRLVPKRHPDALPPGTPVPPQPR